MAEIKEESSWPEGIYLIELTDPVVGGEDGIDNLPHKQLAARTQYLKARLEQMGGTVEAFDHSMQESLFAGVKLGIDLAGLAMKEHEQTRFTRFQEIEVVIKNRGIKSGVTLSKSTTATRNISCSDGVVFMNGREYPVANQENTASVASNTTDKAGTVIIYMFQTSAGIIDVAATTLNGALPDGAIELARATVPAGNTEENDPYLESVTITDSARREPGWPQVQKSPASVAVALNRLLPDAGYHVCVEVLDRAGGAQQEGDIRATDRLKNGFKLVTTGSADNVKARLLVAHPGI